MQKRKLGNSNLEVSAIGLGCMGMSFSGSVATLQVARDRLAGCSSWPAYHGLPAKLQHFPADWIEAYKMYVSPNPPISHLSAPTAAESPES